MTLQRWQPEFSPFAEAFGEDAVLRKANGAPDIPVTIIVIRDESIDSNLREHSTQYDFNTDHSDIVQGDTIVYRDQDCVVTLIFPSEGWWEGQMQV